MIKVVPYFINHAGCPHQCSFCNQRVINGKIEQPLSDFEAFLTKFQTLHDGLSRYQLAFFGGSFTALPEDLMLQYLKIAKGWIDAKVFESIRISTRPDAITLEKLGILADYGVAAIELGVQSLDNHVLAESRRGHEAMAVVSASQMILSRGFELGHQVMLGLPKQTLHSFRQTVQGVIALKPHTVRIYPVQVLKDTPLADDFLKGLYQPIPLAQALEETAWAVNAFRKAGIRVIKIGLQAHEALMDPDVRLAGPYHPAYGEWVEGLIIQSKLQWGLDELLVRRKAVTAPKKITILCHPRWVSRVSGLSKQNKVWLEANWQMTLEIQGEPEIGPGEMLLNIGSVILALPV